MATQILIGGRPVGSGNRCYLIAEIGINHNGDINLAKELILAASKAGFDAVKFQKRTVDACYTKEELAAVRPGPSPWGDDITNDVQKRKLEFGYNEYAEISRFCREIGIHWFASPWDEESVDFLELFDPVCHKIASARARDEDKFWRYLRQTGRPIILSTGACTEEDVRHAVDVLGPEDLMLMHCVLKYPCEIAEANIQMVRTLQEWFPDVPVGYSGHEQPITTAPTLAAVAMGAAAVERHITLNRCLYGSDQKASVEPQELVELATGIRMIEDARGDGVKRVLLGEEKNWQKLRRKK